MYTVIFIFAIAVIVYSMVTAKKDIENLIFIDSVCGDIKRMPNIYDVRHSKKKNILQILVYIKLGDMNLTEYDALKHDIDEMLKNKLRSIKYRTDMIII